jgi:hypothetical protein
MGGEIMWEYIIIILFILIVWIRTRKRKFFWKAKDGTELTFKQFIKRWKEGVETTSPLQQVKISLWGYPLIYGGTITGLIIMIIRREWWLVLILTGTLPILTMNLLSTWQKYKQMKKVYDTIKQLENDTK